MHMLYKMRLIESLVATGTVLVGTSLVVYHVRNKSGDLAGAAALLATLSALRLASDEHRAYFTGAAKGLWGYLSTRV